MSIFDKFDSSDISIIKHNALIESGGKIVWKAPTADSPLNYRVVMPRASSEINPCLLFTKADSTLSHLVPSNGGTFKSLKNSKDMNIPEFGTMVLSEARNWLKSISEEIKAFIDKYKEKVPNISSEELANIAINIRNKFVNAARNAIFDKRIFASLENDKPLLSYKDRERALATDKENPLSGEALNKKIYEEAFDV